MCGVQRSRVCRKSRFLEHSISRRRHASALGPERRLSHPPVSPSPRQDNIDRASQVLAQGVPPGVPRSYRALTHLCGLVVHEGGTNVSCTTNVYSIVQCCNPTLV